MKPNLLLSVQEGPHGKGEVIPINRANPKASSTVVHWLITAPGYHPYWTQFVLYVVSLADDPNFPSAQLRIPDATHELGVLAINPEPGTYTIERVREHEVSGDMPFLSPPSVVTQFVATREEMLTLAWLAVHGIVSGLANPEPPFGAGTHWQEWQVMLDHTLEHLREGGHES